MRGQLILLDIHIEPIPSGPPTDSCGQFVVGSQEDFVTLEKRQEASQSIERKNNHFR